MKKTLLLVAVLFLSVGLFAVDGFINDLGQYEVDGLLLSVADADDEDQIVVAIYIGTYLGVDDYTVFIFEPNPSVKTPLEEYMEHIAAIHLAGSAEAYLRFIIPQMEYLVDDNGASYYYLYTK